MPSVVIVCEGEHDSLDLRLLDLILAQTHALPIRIVPAGNQVKVVRSWHEKQGTKGSETIAISVHDRDYQTFSQVELGWSDPTARSLVWRFHEIENCLVAPWVIQGAFDEYRRTLPSAQWVTQLPTNESDIESLLQQQAARLLTNHIARTLCHELRLEKIASGQKTEINVPSGPDVLAATKNEWQQAILGMVHQMHSACNALLVHSAFQQPQVLQAWDRIEQEVRGASFLDSGRYGRELEGKRLLNLLWQHIRQHCRYPGNQGDFEKDLVSSFGRLYQPSSPRVVDDFETLVTRIGSLLTQPKAST